MSAGPPTEEQEQVLAGLPTEPLADVDRVADREPLADVGLGVDGGPPADICQAAVKGAGTVVSWGVSHDINRDDMAVELGLWAGMVLRC